MTDGLCCPLTDAEERLWRERLAALLARQIAQYTAQESTSVPSATARELLRGILFCLAVPEEGAGAEAAERTGRIRVLLPCSLAAELRRGQCRARENACRMLAQWRTLVRTLPPLDSRALHDTLRSIGRGFRRYDARFFPHRFACAIDYPLALPVPESLPEVRGAACYLGHLAAEHALLARLPEGEVRAVLERTCPDWRGLLVNLYAPAAANALARTLLGRGETLTLTDSEVERLRARWEHRTPAQIEAELHAAADELAGRLGLLPDAAAYLHACAGETAIRAALLRDCGGLRGVFV